MKLHDKEKQAVRSRDTILIKPEDATQDFSETFVYSDGFYPDCVKIRESSMQEADMADMLFQIVVVQPASMHLARQGSQQLEEHQYERQLSLADMVRDEEVQFGMQVVLVHLRSSKYVTLKQEDDESENYIITLQSTLTNKCLFKVIPCYKSQVQNSLTVTYDSDIFLTSVFLEKSNSSHEENQFSQQTLHSLTYLALVQREGENPVEASSPRRNKKMQIQIDKIIEEEEEEMYQSRHSESMKSSLHSPFDIPLPQQPRDINKSQMVIQEYSNYASFLGDFALQAEKGTPFRMQLYQQFIERDTIQYGDCVRLQHLQTNSFLEVLNEKDDQTPPVANHLDIESEYEQLVSRGNNVLFFQLKNDRQTELMHMIEKGFNVYKTRQAAWRLVRVDGWHSNRSTQICSNDRVYIQNVHTLLYLAVNYTEPNVKRNKAKQVSHTLILEKYPGEDCEFQIVQENESKHIQTNSIFYLTHRVSNLYLSIENKMLDEDVKDEKQIFDPNISFRRPTMNEVLNQGDCFRFRVLDAKDQVAFNHLDSSLKILRFSVLYFRLQSKRVMERMRNDSDDRIMTGFFLEIFSQCMSCLSDLVRFALEMERGEEVTKESVANHRPNPQHQRLLREKELPSLCLVLLENLVPNLTMVKWVRSSGETIPGSSPNQRQSVMHGRHSVYSQVRQSIINQTNKDQRDVLMQDLRDVCKHYNDLVRMIYLFVETFGKQNQENSVIVLILYYNLQQHLGYGLGAGYCLIRTFQTNQHLLYMVNTARFTTQRDGGLTILDVLFRRSSQIRSDLGIIYWTNLLRILKLFCVNQDVAFNQNQISIGTRLFGETDVLLPIYSDTQEQLIVKVHDGTYDPSKSVIARMEQSMQSSGTVIEGERTQFELLDLYKLSTGRNKRLDLNVNKKTHALVIEYINNQLDLISDLCQGRNYYNITNIRERIKANELAKYMRNDKMDDILRSKLLTIMLNVYVDAEPYSAVLYPRFLRKTVRKISYEKSNYEQARTATEPVGSDSDIEMTSQWGLKSLLTSVYDNAVAPAPDEKEIDTVLGIHRGSVENLVATKEGGSLTVQHIETIKTFVQMCLFDKILVTDKQTMQIRIQLTHFNSKIFQLFQKMYAFKLISTKGFDNKKLLYTYMQKLLEVQEYLPGSVQDIFQPKELGCYIQITEHLYDIYKHFVMQEEHFNSQRIINFLCDHVNKPKSKISQLVQELKDELPPLRFNSHLGGHLDQHYGALLATTDRIVDLSQLQDHFSKSNVFDMTISQLLLPANNFSCNKRIFDFLIYYMHPRKNIIRNLRKNQIVLQPDERSVLKYLKRLSKQLLSVSEKSENFGLKQGFAEEEQAGIEKVTELLTKVEMLLYCKSRIDPIKGVPKLGDSTEVSFARQSMLRNIGIHRSILKLVENLCVIARRVDEQVRSMVQNPARYSKQDDAYQPTITLLKLAFKMLTLFVMNHNIKNKKIIFMNIHVLTPYLRLININQYRLIAEIFKDNPELCLYVQYSFLRELIQHSNYHSLQIIENLIQAGGYTIHININKIIQLVFNKTSFYHFLGMTSFDLQGQIAISSQRHNNPSSSFNLMTSAVSVAKAPNMVAEFELELPNVPFEFIEMVGRMPYLYQARAIYLLRLLYQLSPAQKQFQSLFLQLLSPTIFFRFVSSEIDLFKPQWNIHDRTTKQQKSCIAVLKTHLKIQIMCLLRDIILNSDKVFTQAIVIQQLSDFFDQEEGRIIKIEDSYKDLLVQLKELEIQTHCLNLEEMSNDSTLIRSWVERLLGVVTAFSRSQDSITCILSDEDESDASSEKSAKEPQQDTYFELVCWYMCQIQRHEMDCNRQMTMDGLPLQPRLEFFQYRINFNIFYLESVFGLTAAVIRSLQNHLIKAETQDENTQLSNLSTRSFSISGVKSMKSRTFDDPFKRTTSMEINNLNRENKGEDTLSKKLKLMQALLDKTTSFSLTFEGYLSENLTVEEYVANQELITRSTDEFFSIFNRYLSFGFMSDPFAMQQLHDLSYKKPKASMFINRYTSQEFIIDSRLQDLVRIQDEFSSDTKLHKLTYFVLGILTSSFVRQQILLEEHLHFVSMLRRHTRFTDVVAKVFEILKSGLANFQLNDRDPMQQRDNAQVVLKSIEMISHLLDLEGIEIDQGREHASKDFEAKHRRNQDRHDYTNADVVQRVKNARAQRQRQELQTQIGNMGFFNLLFEFVGQSSQDMLEEVNDYSLMDLWSDEDNNESSEADQLKYVKKKFGSKIFRGLISISVKLIKGDEEVNKSNQDRFYEEITRQKTNIFLKRIHNMISHEILEFPRIQSDIKISLKDDLKRIRFSYHFHEEHILSTQPSSSLNTLAYQLSKKQTKFVLKNFHKEIFEKIKRDPKLLFQQSVRTQSAELFTDFLLSEQTIFFILKFMQILVEDHHSNLQNYLREQKGSQNYDMVSKIVDLLRVYLNEVFGFGTRQDNSFDYINLSYQTQLKVIQCFDVLKELVQGSCPRNQAIVCQPNFLKMVSNVLGLDDSHLQFRRMYDEIITSYFKDKKSLTERMARSLNMKRTYQRIKTYLAQRQTLNEYKAVDVPKQSERTKARNIFRQQWSQTQMRILMHYGQIFPFYAKQLAQSFQVTNPSNFKIAMVSQLKYKSVVTLESIVDGDQTQLLEQITSIIPENLITQNIATIYEKYKVVYKTGKQYKNESFEHMSSTAPNFDIEYDIERCIQLNLKTYDCSKATGFRSSLRQINKKFFKIGSVQEIRSPESALQDLWKSVIVETGFSLFNLLTGYYDIKKNDALERIQEQIEKKRISQQSIYKNKFILFQLLYFCRDLYITSQQILTQINSQHDLERGFVEYKLQKAPREDASAYQLKVGYRALRFFAKRTGTIEILSNQQIKRVLFPLMPLCFTLNNQIKREFASKIDRFSSQTKLESVMVHSLEVIEKLKYEYQFQHLYEKNPLINLFASNIRLWKQLSFVLIICENYYVLTDNEPKYFRTDFSSNNPQLFALQWTQFVLILITFYFFLIKKAPYLGKKAEAKIRERKIERYKSREIKYRYLENKVNLTLIDEDLIVVQEEEHIVTEKWIKVKFLKLQDDILRLTFILWDEEMIYFVLFINLAFFGFLNRFLIAAQLIDVFWRFPTLGNVINSIWRPKKQILLTLFLFVVVQYYFSMVVFFFFPADYQPDCSRLSQCFSMILDVTFKIDGGFVGFFLGQHSEQYTDPNYRFNEQSLVEFIYVFIVINLIYSIITGIIIDTFGVLRSEQEEKLADIQGYCLICGIDRGTIDKKSKHKKGFPFHVKYEHNQWNYIFYISYLEDKSKSEYFGFESYVAEIIKKQEITWFPMNRALCIPGESDQTEELQLLKNTLDSRLQSLEEKIEILLSRTMKADTLPQQTAI